MSPASVSKKSAPRIACETQVIVNAERNLLLILNQGLTIVDQKSLFDLWDWMYRINEARKK